MYTKRLQRIGIGESPILESMRNGLMSGSWKLE